MANKKKYIGTRVDSQLHEKIEQYLDKQGMSLSEFVRTSVEYSLAESQTDGKQPLADEQTNHTAIEALTGQLTIKDSQIEHLQTELSQARQGSEEASERSDTIIAQMTKQLDGAQLMLADMRKRPVGWKRLFRWT